jgi:hypothetical protein
MSGNTSDCDRDRSPRGLLGWTCKLHWELRWAPVSPSHLTKTTGAIRLDDSVAEYCSRSFSSSSPPKPTAARNAEVQSSLCSAK